MLKKNLLIFFIYNLNYNSDENILDSNIKKIYKIIGTIAVISTIIYGGSNIYNYYLNKNKKQEEIILKENIEKEFLEFFKTNDLPYLEYKNNFPFLFRFQPSLELIKNLNFEDRIEKANIIIEKIKEISNKKIKTAKYKQEILLDKFMLLEHQWLLVKNHNQIKKELFDFFLEKNIFEKSEYELFEIYLTDNNSLKLYSNRLKNKSINEINIILNKIFEIKNKIEIINNKGNYNILLKQINNLYEDFNNYKKQIK